MNKKYATEAKRYGRDDEVGDEFDTWAEAEEWFKEQQKYGFNAMWVNNERVKLHNGVLVIDEAFIVPASTLAETLLSGLAQANVEFDRIFRPQPTRGSAPTNPATLAAKGDSV